MWVGECWPHPPPAPTTCLQATHRLAHCLAGSPGLSLHLLPQQFSVEEGGLTQVLVGHGSSGAVATSPGPAAPSRAIVPTWLSWVPSPWAWAGSGHARQTHSSWMWLKHRLAVAAELLCLEEVSMGSSWESRRRPGFGGALDESQYPQAWVLTHCVHIHSSLKSPLSLVPQHLQPKLHGGQERGVDASQGQGAAIPVAGGQSEHAQLRHPKPAWPRVPGQRGT